MQGGGFHGRFLQVDLSNGQLADEFPDESLFREFVGGYGVGARVLYERMPAGADPLGPDNVLGLVTGILTGTRSPSAGRFIAVGKSPLTGGWGDANSGGKFGPVLKSTGYDAVFVRGIADRPVYLIIDGNRASLLPADDLWGQDAARTEEILQARHGKGSEVACIGPAGEQLVRFACIMTDKGRAAGRSGLGAVMGSKKLKAVVVRGNIKPPVHDPERLRAMANKYLPEIKFKNEEMSQYGTAGSTGALVEIGRTPIKNWRGGYPDDFANVAVMEGSELAVYEEKKYGCWGCPIACGAILRWGEGEQNGHRPEYETMASLGTYCGIDDLLSILELNEYCNRAGLDTISAGGVVAFTMECYEHELIDPDSLDGMELRWGDGQAAARLLKKIVERRGIGDVLAEGVLRASKMIGPESEQFAIHAGGQELPAHDPRNLKELALQYQISPTPGRHTQGGGWIGEMSPEDFLPFGLDPKQAEEAPDLFWAQAYALYNAWWNTLQASGLCFFISTGLSPVFLHELLSAATGWELDMDECIRIGERIEVVRHMFGLREGINPLENKIADRALGRPPLTAGPMAGVSVDIEKLKAFYLQRMDWDPNTAAPSQESLERLGIGDLV